MEGQGADGPIADPEAQVSGPTEDKVVVVEEPKSEPKSEPNLGQTENGDEKASPSPKKAEEDPSPKQPSENLDEEMKVTVSSSSGGEDRDDRRVEMSRSSQARTHKKEVRERDEVLESPSHVEEKSPETAAPPSPVAQAEEASQEDKVSNDSEEHKDEQRSPFQDQPTEAGLEIDTETKARAKENGSSSSQKGVPPNMRRESFTQILKSKYLFFLFHSKKKKKKRREEKRLRLTTMIF